MLTPNQQSLEIEISTLLQKSRGLEEFLSTLRTQFSEKIVSACEYLFFIIQCELFSENKTTFAIISLLTLSQEFGLLMYHVETLVFVRDSRAASYKVAAHSFLMDPKMTQAFQLDSEGLRGHLDKLPVAKKLGDAEKRIEAEIAKYPAGGSQFRRPPFFLDNQAPQNLDPPELFVETAKAYVALSDLLRDNQDPDLLLPLPSVVEPSVDDMMTPLPFVLEAPLFNPDFSQAQTATLILRNFAKANEFDAEAA